MEADLARFYGIDYRDRWHPDRRHRLTLRRICVLVWRYPPPEGAVMRLANDNRAPWQLINHQLDDVRLTILATTEGVKASALKPHPERDAIGRRAREAARARRDADPERHRRRLAAQARARERRRAIAAGEIT